MWQKREMREREKKEKIGYREHTETPFFYMHDIVRNILILTTTWKTTKQVNN